MFNHSRLPTTKKKRLLLLLIPCLTSLKTRQPNAYQSIEMGTIAFDSTDKQTNGKLFTIMLTNEFIAPPSELNIGQGQSYGLQSGSADPDDFFKISDKLLFIMKLTPAAQ
jgi:hypothetical protein